MVTLRWAVIRAVAARDIARVQPRTRRSGFRWLAGLLVAALAAVPGRESAPAESNPRPRVAGIVPDALAPLVVADPNAPVELLPGPPVTVRGTWVSPALRATLDGALPGPTVDVARVEAPLPLPSRNVWVVLLAVSLLTGPLVESVPGERAQRTWETLRSAAISPFEVWLGKWWAWNRTAGLLLSGSLALGWLTGAQTPGLAWLGIPLVVAQAVACGLWLLRDVSDPAAAATIPVRVLPLVLVSTGILAYTWMPDAPALVGWIPFGGAMALAANVGPAATVLPGAVGSTVLTTAAFLAHSAAAADEPQAGGAGRSQRAWGALAAVLAGAMPAWAALGWSWAGSAVVGDIAAAWWAAGLGWLCAAALDHANQTPPPGGPSGAAPIRWGAAVAVALFIAGVDLLTPPLYTVGSPLATMPTSALLPVAVCVLGQEWVFRGVLTRAMGPIGAGLVWALVVNPVDPATAVAGAVGLAWLASVGGVRSSFVAHALWMVAKMIGGWGA